MVIHAFDHYTLRCADLAASWRFYEMALGFHVVDRPLTTNVKAAKVKVGDVDVVHLFQATPEMDTVFVRMTQVDAECAEWPTGRLQHVGFWATDHRAMKNRLTGEGVQFKEWTLPDKHQLVMRDPDGTEIEVNFPLAELDPALPVVRPPWLAQ